MSEASNGPKYLLQNKSALNSTPSHLGPFTDRISFGILLRAPSTNLIISNLFDLRGLTIGSSCHGRIISWKTIILPAE
jgi:hypothetical protein